MSKNFEELVAEHLATVEDLKRRLEETELAARGLRSSMSLASYILAEAIMKKRGLRPGDDIKVSLNDGEEKTYTFKGLAWVEEGSIGGVYIIGEEVKDGIGTGSITPFLQATSLVNW